MEGWVAGGMEVGRSCGEGVGEMGVEDDEEEEEEDVEMEGDGEGGVRGWRGLWESAPVVGNEEARKYDWGGVGEEEEDEEDGEEGEEGKVGKGQERGVGVDGWLRVLSKGEVGR